MRFFIINRFKFIKIAIIISHIVFGNYYVFSQLEGNNLCFAPNINLDFNCGNAVVTNNLANLYSTISSISDNNGNLLFYIDHGSIFNKNHQYMKGYIDPYYNVFGPLKNVIIVPQPGNSKRYNLIYISSDVPYKGIHYLSRILIDMNYNNGLGQVILKESFVANIPSRTGLSAARHQNMRDFWILTVKGDSLLAFLLNDNTFSTTPIISYQPLFIGSLRQTNVIYHTMSYDQKHIAFYYHLLPYSTICINDFNNSTGKLTGMKYFNTIQIDRNSRGYMSFSPSGKFLYVANGNKPATPINIIQYDISLNTRIAIESSGEDIGCTTTQDWGEMIIAPDNKIYVAKLGNYIGVINSPEIKGAACNYIDTGLFHGNNGLNNSAPNFITRKPYISRFNFSGICTNKPTTFTYILDKDSNLFEWDFGDPNSDLANISYLDDPSHIYKNPGRYKVRLITNRNGIKDTSARFICIEKGPVNSVISDTFFCKTDNIILDAGNDGYKYLWSTGDTFKNISVKDTGIYIVTVNNNNCYITDTFRVFPGISDTSIFNYNDTFLCSGGSIKIDIKLKNLKYIWSTGDTTSSIVTSSGGIYIAQVQNGKCTLTDTVNIKLKHTPIVNLGNDTALCSGEIIILEANNPGAKYKWNTGEISHSIIINNKGTYNVIVNKDSCRGFDTINISLFPLPNLSLGNDTVICEDDTQTIILDAGINTKYQWFPGNENTSNITIKSPGIYSVIITDSNGCKNSDSILITENCKVYVFVPNAFTPNNDGLNDFFIVSGKRFIIYEMKIFNLWGENIFYSNSSDNVWDGKFKSEDCQQGKYLYIFKYSIDNIQNTLSGTITLLR